MVDAGYYMCTATNAIGTDIKSFHLKVLGKSCSGRNKKLIIRNWVGVMFNTTFTNISVIS
jgi:hypothetical protein